MSDSERHTAERRLEGHGLSSDIPSPRARAELRTNAPDSVRFPNDPRAFGGGGHPLNTPHRAECDLFDCEVEGRLPPDLDGAFVRIGPDPQYPKPPQYEHDVPFDGEGHVSLFRIRNGHVDYRSRYVRTQRWKAQHAARRSLFGMYRNPLTK
ncbi:MAG TPA: carotenoid oxygenase family protein [Candidatus Paceibacterota bacterium]|jgi:hypothetical protein|nr:carotenoid oxygenase family protein [Candidatus Paceibacterota bacterium]